VRRQLMFWPALALTVMVSFAQAPQKIGVINVQSALIGTQEGKKAAADLQATRAPKTKELQEKQAEIKSLQESLQRGGNAMADSAKAELVRSIDEKTKAFNRELEDAQSDWQDQQNRVLDVLLRKMQAVIDKYGRDNGFSLIVDVSNPNSPIVFASNAIDITKNIIDLYDRSAPATSTSLETPGGKPANATPLSTPLSTRTKLPPPTTTKK
jgi:outer membrane protein